MIVVLSQRIPLPFSVEMAEALAARLALLFAQELSLSKVLMEGDCLRVVSALNSPVCYNTLYRNVVEETRCQARRFILEAAILTFVAVVSLTLYTFWAVKRGKDFSFLGPFLFASLLMLLVFGLIQIFIPLGKIFVMVYSGLASLIFCGYLVHDTENMIKRYSYDDYIWAAVVFYLDVINIFLNLLNLLDAAC